jgi:predicted nucleic acid-binding protein
MILLDTDHLSVFMDKRDPRNRLLKARMEAAEDDVACPIVSAEELLRGWLAFIHRMRDVHQQLSAYDRLANLFDVLSDWSIVRFETRQTSSSACADTAFASALWTSRSPPSRSYMARNCSRQTRATSSKCPG